MKEWTRKKKKRRSATNTRRALIDVGDVSDDREIDVVLNTEELRCVIDPRSAFY